MARFVDLDDAEDAGSAQSAGQSLGHAGYVHPVGHDPDAQSFPSPGGPHDGGPRADGAHPAHHEDAPMPAPIPGHLLHHVEPRLHHNNQPLDDSSSNNSLLPSHHNLLQHESQRQLLINKLKLLSAAPRDGPWSHSLYNPKPIGIMDDKTFQSPVTDAFQCYPIVAAIASSIDLNTLDALSRTCRLIYLGLVQYKSSIRTLTLKCVNESLPTDPDETFRFRARASNWFYMEDGRSYNGKSGDCARDMVSECRRCGEVVCRNCAIKPPAPVTLRERHRRLCKACVHAPIATLAKPPLDPDLPLACDVVQQAICKCETEAVWLCQPCGRSIRGADHEYQRIWRWRNQYGEILGGLGTGIGEGDRGVICGREADCCAAKEREQQLDCDAEDARDANGIPAPAPTLAPVDSLIDELRLTHERTPSPSLGPGYHRHEIEGIGGVVKRKRVQMVRVGACVPEWEDERTSGSRVLGREVRGVRRSWCGWCWRAIPGEKDLKNEPPSSSSSSAGGSRRTSTANSLSGDL